MMILQKLGWQLENSYARLPDKMYSWAKPERAPEPQLVIFNEALADELGLSLAGLSEAELIGLFSGNDLPEELTPLAQAYAGHQFGYFTMLGDGRALLLGEHKCPDGRLVDLQWKGSGRTPYSRNGDGLAALGPMLREYIISEAMKALGIPSTRSLAVIATGRSVARESYLPGALLTRVATSHIRVGTFEYVASQRDITLLQKLVDYTIQRHAPELAKAENPALALLDYMIEKQVALILNWMRVGFIHGVMNTDNMALSGESIDFGPCAFMDHYDHYQVFSSIDQQGRYAYGNQPIIGQWNLARFAEAILPLLHADQEEGIKLAEARIAGVKEKFDQGWLVMMGQKLGFSELKTGDKILIQWVLDWMQSHNQDFTNSFRKLSNLEALSEEDAEFQDWYGKWLARLEDKEGAKALMKSVNPAVIPRNHLVEEALSTASEKGDLRPLHALLEAIKSPYQDREADRYSLPAPDGGASYKTFCGT